MLDTQFANRHRLRVISEYQQVNLEVWCTLPGRSERSALPLKADMLDGQIDASKMLIADIVPPQAVRIGHVRLMLVAVITSILLIAALRVGIFSIIGVIDQIRSRGEFLNVVLGTVSVATVPQGRSESFLISGRNLFNHIKIYDDERTISRILSFIRDALRQDKDTKLSGGVQVESRGNEMRDL